MRHVRPAFLIVLLACLATGSVWGAGAEAGRVFVDPARRYYVTLPDDWRATAGGEFVTCRPAGRSDVALGIAVLPTTNFELDPVRLNQVADLWVVRVQSREPYLVPTGERQDATYFRRPAVHVMLRGRPPHADEDEVRRLTLIACRGYAYFVYADASSPELFDEQRAAFDALLGSLTDLSPALLEKVLLQAPAMKMDPYKVPVHDFVLENRNDFTVDNLFIKVDYHTVLKTPLETCLVRVNVRILPGERLVVRNFQALPLRPQYDYSRYYAASIELVDAARAFDQGMGGLRSSDSIVGYRLDLGGAARADSPNDVIAYCRGNELWLMDGRGRRTWRLYSGRAALRDPAWSPDRTQIAVTDGGSVVLLELDAKGALARSVPLLAQGAGSEFVERQWYSAPTWVRDGAALFSMEHKQFAPLAPPTLSAAERNVVTRMAKLSLATLSTDTVRVHANPDDFSTRYDTFDAVVYCSPRSDLLAYTRLPRGAATPPAQEGEIVFADFTGKVLKAVPVRGLYGRALAWSPDGRQIAFVRLDDRGGTNVCVLDLGERSVTQLTSLMPVEGAVGALDWSADGKWIVFEKTIAADRSQDLFKVHARGRTLVRLTENGISGSPAWFGR